MEILITFITILSAILGIYLFFKTSVSETLEQEDFLSKFDNASRNNKRFIEELKAYTSNKVDPEDHFMQGINFGEALSTLEFAQEEFFSTEKRDQLKKSNNHVAVRGAINSLEIHNKDLIESRNYFYKHFLNETMEEMLTRVKEED